MENKRFFLSIVFSLLLFFLTSCTGVLGLVPPAEAIVTDQKIAIPAYFYPGSLWEAIEDATHYKVPFIVANPNSGPGDVSNPAYVTAIANAQAANIKVIGYVPTDYGDRPASEIKADIDKYRTWYDIDGIFFDEVTSGSTTLSYYEDLADYVHAQPNEGVVLNPGVYPVEGYMDFADIIITYEGTYKGYVGSHLSPGWVYNYPSTRFWHLIYDVPSATSMHEVMDFSRNRNAGYVYITDDNFLDAHNVQTNNPWDSLPFYWADHVSRVGTNAVLSWNRILVDNFSRAADENNGWGTPEVSSGVGNVWTVNTGDPANFSVDALTPTGTVGPRHAKIQSSTTTLQSIHSSVSVARDIDMSVRLALDKVVSGTNQYAISYLVGRRTVSSGSPTEYRVLVRFASSNTSSGGISLHAAKIVGGTVGALGTATTVTGLTYESNKFIRVRAQIYSINPTNIRVKAWEDGTPEPAAWNFTTSDSTAGLQVQGKTGYAFSLTSTSNILNLPITSIVDSFAVNKDI